MLKKEAKEITGGLSKPSKMPGPSYNLPAAACITGAKLAKIPGSNKPQAASHKPDTIER